MTQDMINEMLKILLEEVTRFEVIDHSTSGEGRVFVLNNKSYILSLQDDKRTLKVFINDLKEYDDK